MSQLLAFPSILAFPMQNTKRSKPLEQHTDEELIQLHSSNTKVFPIILQRYYQKIYRYCHSFLRDENLSAEATQEIFELSHLNEVGPISVLPRCIISDSLRSGGISEFQRGPTILL